MSERPELYFYYNEAARMLNSVIAGTCQGENRKFIIEEVSKEADKLNHEIDRAKKSMTSDRYSYWQTKLIDLRTRINELRSNK